MGFVRVIQGQVGLFEEGRVVAEEWFADLERLLGLGVVQRVDPRDVPTDAVPAPEPPPDQPPPAEPAPATAEPAPEATTPEDATAEAPKEATKSTS